MPNRTYLRAAHPLAFGVYVVAVDPLRRLHDARFIEVVACAVDPFPARKHGAGIMLRPDAEAPSLVKCLPQKETLCKQEGW